MKREMASSSAIGAALVAAMLISTQAVGQTAPASTAPPKADGVDLNQVVCEKQEIIGSRLTSRRVCHTRAEWADLRLQDRQAVEKIQINRPMKGE
jgi:hypothetical protein